MSGFASPRLDRPMKVTIGFTETCNLDCRVCYADCHRPGKPAELTAVQWQPLLADFFASGVISLMIEGGEPLLRPDLFALLEGATPQAMVRLRTHATLVDATMAERLKAVGLGDAMVDLLGATPATHDALTGVPGSHAASLAGLRALRAAGLPVTVLVIMNRANLHELQPLLELAHSLGAEAVGVLRPYPLGRMRREWPLLSLGLSEMMDAIGTLRPPEGLRLMQSWHPNDANCCWQMAAVNAHGRSIGCMYLRDYVDYGDVTRVPLMTTWEHPLYRRLRAGQVEAACGACSTSQHSHGGCRSTAYAFHGRWDAPDPFDAGLNDGVDLRVLPDAL